LGLWKQGLLQDPALDYLGKVELIDFGIPLADIQAILGVEPAVQRITSQRAIAQLPLPRPLTAHKYTNGHLLLICGSRRYAGAALLTGLGARASGVGMVSIAVPQSLKPMVVAQLPEALVIECPETESGAILYLPEEVDLNRYSAIACGPGLTPEAKPVVRSALSSALPLVLDADGLNILAKWGAIAMLNSRQATTILTPHLGEFKRLFPPLVDQLDCRVTAVRQAAAATEAIVLLKGARVAIADHQTVWINPRSTPALARGGSGDILTGLIGGLIAQKISPPSPPAPLPPAPCSSASSPTPAPLPPAPCSPASSPSPLSPSIQAAAWWHSQAGILAAQERTELGVDAYTLSQYLIPALAGYCRRQEAKRL
jgi:NAD(P)H-hydrate epimerase